MRQCIFIILTSVLLAATFAFAAGQDDILGLWNTEQKDARIEIYKCGTNFCGKIAWLKQATYEAGSKEGVPGTPILDHNNPNPEFRKRPLIGSLILIDFVFAGDHLWKDGEIYNSSNGKMYSGKLTLISPDQLNVRGFILGISLFGGSTTWTRTKARTE